ncbi:MAG: ribonuclease HII [Rhodobacteraceae bacterium]|jgi:ribonuclease HII|nr:ribonuclease HII [Paracoccaceae bacterium]
MSAPARAPDFLHEARWHARGFSAVAGVDEVGRGPLAGPVVAAAVILSGPGTIAGLADSKALSAARRGALAALVRERALVGLGWASAAEIDTMNIRQASLAAMARALAALPRPPAAVLVDGRDLPPGLPWPGEAVVGGDARCLSVAAASIVAKVARDAHMVALAQQFPGYGWEHNAGYPTSGHLAALARLGPTAEHRRSFRPVHNILCGSADQVLDSQDN